MTQSVWAHTNFNAQRFELILQNLDREEVKLDPETNRNGFDSIWPKRSNQAVKKAYG